jgi:hypothetical protein
MGGVQRGPARPRPPGAPGGQQHPVTGRHRRRSQAASPSRRASAAHWQRRRLPGVGHHVRERRTRAEAGDGHGAALPAIVRPPVEQLAVHKRRAKVRRLFDSDPLASRCDGRAVNPSRARLRTGLSLSLRLSARQCSDDRPGTGLDHRDVASP